MGGFFNVGSSGNLIAYAEVDAAGSLLNGIHIVNATLNGLGDYTVTFEPGFFTSPPLGWVNGISDAIGYLLGATTISGNVIMLDPTTGSNDNKPFYFFAIQL